LPFGITYPKVVTEIDRVGRVAACASD